MLGAVSWIAGARIVAEWSAVAASVPSASTLGPPTSNGLNVHDVRGMGVRAVEMSK